MPLAHDLEHAQYARMRWNTPLSEEHARLLLTRLEIHPGASLLDLGCGWGELLLRAVDSAGVTSGIGVDTDAQALARGRSLAADRGLDGRVTFVCNSAVDWHQPAGRVICVGAAHAWGGAEAALTAVAQLVQPGGQVLFGDGCWERPPTKEAVDLFGPAVLTLGELVNSVQKTPWRILHLSTADQREWDNLSQLGAPDIRSGCSSTRRLSERPRFVKKWTSNSGSTSARIGGCSAFATSSSAGSRQ